MVGIILMYVTLPDVVRVQADHIVAARSFDCWDVWQGSFLGSWSAQDRSWTIESKCRKAQAVSVSTVMVYLDARHALVVRTNEVVEYTGGKLKSLGAKGPRFALCSYLALATSELRPWLRLTWDMGDNSIKQVASVRQSLSVTLLSP